MLKLLKTCYILHFPVCQGSTFSLKVLFIIVYIWFLPDPETCCVDQVHVEVIRPSCFCLLEARIEGIKDHAQLIFLIHLFLFRTDSNQVHYIEIWANHEHDIININKMDSLIVFSFFHKPFKVYPCCSMNLYFFPFYNYITLCHVNISWFLYAIQQLIEI